MLLPRPNKARATESYDERQMSNDSVINTKKRLNSILVHKHTNTNTKNNRQTKETDQGGERTGGWIDVCRHARKNIDIG